MNDLPIAHATIGALTVLAGAVSFFHRPAPHSNAPEDPDAARDYIAEQNQGSRNSSIALIVFGTLQIALSLYQFLLIRPE